MKVKISMGLSTNAIFLKSREFKDIKYDQTRPGQRREESNLADLILELAFLLLLLWNQTLQMKWPTWLPYMEEQHSFESQCQPQGGRGSDQPWMCSPPPPPGPAG